MLLNTTPNKNRYEPDIYIKAEVQILWEKRCKRMKIACEYHKIEKGGAYSIS